MTGDSLFAVEKGDAGPVIAFLHGFGGSHRGWSYIQAALSQHARTIAFDLPGHGQSIGFPDAGPVRVAVLALLDEIERRSIAPVHLVGHSMGGAVAALAALRKPEAVASLTLLAPGGFGTEINHRLLDRYAAAADEDMFRAALENMYGWNNPVDDEAVTAGLELRRMPGQREKLIEIAGQLHRDGKQGVIPREHLAALTMPAKVLWGTQDRVLPTRQAHRLPPMFAAHIFEDTGHMLPAEIPDAVMTLIRQNMR